MEYDNGIPANAVQKVADLFAADTVVVEKRSKRGLEETDIRPMIRECLVKEDQGDLVLICTVCAQNPSLNPQLLAAAIERHLPECRADHVKCKRLEIFDAEGKVFR